MVFYTPQRHELSPFSSLFSLLNPGPVLFRFTHLGPQLLQQGRARRKRRGFRQVLRPGKRKPPPPPQGEKADATAAAGAQAGEADGGAAKAPAHAKAAADADA